jgi:hypothetical protein
MIVAQLFVVRLWSSVWSFNAAHISCKYTPLPFVKIKIPGPKERERERERDKFEARPFFAG